MAAAEIKKRRTERLVLIVAASTDDERVFALLIANETMMPVATVVAWVAQARCRAKKKTQFATLSPTTQAHLDTVGFGSGETLTRLAAAFAGVLGAGSGGKKASRSRGKEREEEGRRRKKEAERSAQARRGAVGRRAIGRTAACAWQLATAGAVAAPLSLSALGVRQRSPVSRASLSVLGSALGSVLGAQCSALGVRCYGCVSPQ